MNADSRNPLAQDAKIAVTKGKPIAASLAKPHRLHVDCLRGYAILMVIACHTAAQFPELPWRFKQLVASGWHGVQLFFLASTLTLLMSYDWERTQFGRANWKHFFLRRFLRIAPAYYLAAVVYTVGNGTKVTALGTAMFASFINVHIPFRLGQSLVPGDWSVSVEFTFYLLFPLVAMRCHTVVRATVFLILSLLGAVLANTAVLNGLGGCVSGDRLDQFVFFSFLNQLPVFALANLVYHLAYKEAAAAAATGSSSVVAPRVHAAAVPGVLGMLAIAAYLPLPQSFGMQTPWMPGFFWTSLWMSVFCVAVAGDRPRIVINRAVAHIGVVSFSAYLWHWLVLTILRRSSLGEVLCGQTRYAAVAAYCLAFAVVLGATYCLAFVSYRFIELAGISLARRMTMRRPATVAPDCGQRLIPAPLQPHDKLLQPPALELKDESA
jgi:peptidoglycan/LPS O-acetylase OafA/YrhL